MGVPDIQFHKKQFDYQPHRLQQKPEKSKVTNNNMFGNSNKGSNNNNNGEPFVSESKRSYEDRSATAFKEARAKLSRPKTNIKSDVDSSGSGGSITPQKSVNRSEYGKDSVSGGPIERTEKIRPSSNLKNEGSRKWDTGRNEFATAEQKPLKASKMNDNLKPDAEGQIDKTSLNRSEYGKDGLVERPEKIRPSSNLKNEGSRAWDTGRNEFATAEQKPLKASKMNDNLVPDAEGQMDKTSLNRSEYGKDGPMQKPEKIKPPNSNLKNEGILIVVLIFCNYAYIYNINASYIL